MPAVADRRLNEPDLSAVFNREEIQMADDKENASKLLDKRISELGDRRGETLSEVRGIIKEADPDIERGWKWVKPTNPGTPVWSHNGGICTGETYKSVVKLTFFNVLRRTIRPVSSTPVSTRRLGVPSTSTKMTRLTKAH